MTQMKNKTKSDLWVSHGFKNHPMIEYCEDCERVKQEFKQAIKDAGGKKKFIESLKTK